MGGGGGFLAGFTSGLGQTAKDMNQNYMDMQLKRYSSAAKIWESMANDPNIHPTIRQQFSQNALALGNVNLFDKNSRAAADQILKQNPHDSVQKAHDAMSMTGQQMPNYFDQNTGYVNPLEFERQKQKAHYGAEEEAKTEGLKNKLELLGGPQGGSDFLTFGVDPKTPLGQKLLRTNTLALALGKEPIRPTPTTINGHPAVSIGAEYYIDGQPVQQSTATRGGVPHVQTIADPNTGALYKVIITPDGQIIPTGAAAPQQVRGATSVKSTDPVNLRETTQRQNVMSPLPGNLPGTQGGPGVGTSGSQGAVAPPQQPIMPPAGSNAAEMTSPGPTPVSSPSDIYKPAPAEQKAAFGQNEQQGLQDSFTALGLIHDIAALHKQYPVVGKFFGRYVDAANKLGWAGMISTGAQMAGLSGVQQGRDNAISDNLAKLINDDSLAAQFGMTPKEKNEWATASARMITLIRNLGALDVKMTAGGGRGITQLYNMMRPALIDIKQDTPLVIGHSLGIADVAGERIANTLRARYGSDVDRHLDPRHRALLQEFQQYGNVAGNYSQGQAAGNKQVKYSPSTKLFYISSDGGKTWLSSPTRP